MVDYSIQNKKVWGFFDVVFMEGGILHYFYDIDEFMHIMYSLLKNNGKMICSDFHPFTKISEIRCPNAATENILSVRLSILL